MHKGKKILGTMVVDLKAARCFGRVRNLIVDLEDRKILAVILPGTTWLHAPTWFDFSNIQELGTDVLTVNGLAEPVSTKAIEGIKGHLEKGIKKLWGLTVISNKGKLVGYVEDLFIEIPGGSLAGIELSRGVLGDVLEGRGFVPAERILSLSLECVVVEEG